MDDALETLVRYSWPGNIRELENVIEYAFVRTGSESIPLSKLPATVKDKTNGAKPKITIPAGPERFGNGDVTQLLNLLEKHHWNKSKVAEELGIGRTTLWRKLKKIGIDP